MCRLLWNLVKDQEKPATLRAPQWYVSALGKLEMGGGAGTRFFS